MVLNRRRLVAAALLAGGLVGAASVVLAPCVEGWIHAYTHMACPIRAPWWVVR